jgi:hypothetical protein
MYHVLFDSSFKMSVGVIFKISLHGNCFLPVESLPVTGQHLLHLLVALPGKGNPVSIHCKPLQFCGLVKQGEGTGIIDHIIAVPALASDREIFTIPVPEILAAVCAITAPGILHNTLRTYHKREISVNQELSSCISPMQQLPFVGF